MKKRLEADLISIAHRILQLKNKSDINQLFLETQKLYEKLAVLRFVEENFADVKPTIGYAQMESKVENVYNKSEIVPPKPKKATKEIAETSVQPTEEIVKTPAKSLDEISTDVETPVEVVAAINEFETKPFFELTEDSKIETSAPENEVSEVNDFKEISNFELTKDSLIEKSLKPEAVQISFEDLLGGNYNETMFVKANVNESEKTNETFSTIDTQKEQPILNDKVVPQFTEPKAFSLNEKLAKGIHIDLNDRIAFVNNLFGGSNEDYNRVLNQLITFDTYQQTRKFIDEMVKPDYNNWEGKDEYAQRFIEIIEKKFLTF